MKELKLHQKCLDSYLHSKTLNKLKRKIPNPPEAAEESSSTTAHKKSSRNRDRLGNDSRTCLSINSFNVNIVSSPQIQRGGIEILKRYFRRGLSFLRYRKQDGIIYQEVALSLKRKSGGRWLGFLIFYKCYAIICRKKYFENTKKEFFQNSDLKILHS